MNAFLKFRADRAFAEGMRAYTDGQPNHAPARCMEHSSDWVRGWTAAWVAATIEPAQPATKKLEPAQAVPVQQ